MAFSSWCESSRISAANRRTTGRKNPFLPYEPDLYVADVSPTHVCILNKYNVVDLHLLIITRAFEHQESRLRLPDFQALWRCLVEYDSLGFYNSGHLSGASQPHKHLQVVPLPLAGSGCANRVPFEPMLRNAASDVGRDRRNVRRGLCAFVRPAGIRHRSAMSN